MIPNNYSIRKNRIIPKETTDERPNNKTKGCFVRPYLEAQGDLVSRLRIGIIGVTIWLIGVISILTESP